MALQRAGITDKESVKLRALIAQAESEDGFTAKKRDALITRLARGLRVEESVILGHIGKGKAPKRAPPAAE